MLTVLADENIANLDDYLAHHPIKVIKMAGRAINHQSLADHRPDALFIRSVTQVTAENLGDLKGTPLKFVGSATIGTDHVDSTYLAEHQISFTNAAGCSKHSVAQYVVTAILNTCLQFNQKPIKLGIIGLGNIGSTLAYYADQLGWQIAGFDPFLRASKINNASFEEVLTADVISIHTPLTHSGAYPTYRMFNAQIFEKLRPNTLLINSARGEIIEEEALIDTINHKNLQVVLDVFPDEPTISAPLFDALSIATPHIAGYTLEGKIRGTDMIYQAFCRKFDLPIIQRFDALLPPNPYHFSKLLSDQTLENLRQFYDINADYHDLRAVNQAGVSGADFDALRKHYRLRREWIFDCE
ncbi:MULTISPECIES: 4-phosphoerythronate dehydrogenase [Moraxella]|uniref:Erythronate-4-phosphate dehydrogenase n=1 Tax=Moraxella catarrhalis TaxID=480 RepID=A0A7Z1A3X7_MORCA|nr:4-phosphoerythronate dehydrogenase [Moraxella catarrhalis]OAV00784.1 Erythronate-4-phosphate dehydrogenase [Moraxella catarrhalis]STY81278.1 Erythronate-4-phosphate dehydrogenase [Moraxella catarrhalis]